MFYKQILNIRYRELGEELINEFTDTVKEIDINKYWLYIKKDDMPEEFSMAEKKIESTLDKLGISPSLIFLFSII